MTRGAAPTLSLLEHSNSDVKSEECQSESHGGQNGDDDDDGDNHHGDNDVGDPQAALSPQSSGDHGLGHYNLQHGAFTVTTRSNGCPAPPQQLELVDHSFACASNLYANPYYGGMMIASYGPQPLVHPHLVGLHHTRMPLPLEVAEEPVYVNAKQYHGILRRRRSRAKAELEQKLIKVRKPYLHESRHQHAMRRLRGSGGRFAKKVDLDASNRPAEEKGISSSNGKHNEKGSQGDGTHLAQKYTNGGICPGEPWGTIASKQPPQRALVML